MSKHELIGQRFPVLDRGHVELIDFMGSDHDICDAARLSYGKGTKSVSEDRTLIRHLMRHRHTSPFEQAEIKIGVKMPMDVNRQWIRHRTASVNEYSTRYSEAIDDIAATAPGGWRSQSTANKQGSGGTVDVWVDGTFSRDVFSGLPDPDEWDSPGEYLSSREDSLHRLSREVYQERLKFGVAREQARKDLPLSNYTELYWKCDLHNVLHFLSLRMDSHAQKEIREYANIIGNEIVAKLFPLTWEAFCDYRLNAITLSLQDRVALVHCLRGMEPPEALDRAGVNNKRERDEFLSKLPLILGEK